MRFKTIDTLSELSLKISEQNLLSFLSIRKSKKPLSRGKRDFLRKILNLVKKIFRFS